ncbi:MAG: M48 family metallopeptidase [Hyphomonadaceae bacterium]|nr:M48 family metallopeptidase [Hyphomonadaceae bacterium]
MHWKFSRRSIVLGAAASLAGCVTNPETGREQLILVDDGQLTQMALQSWGQLVSQTPVWHNPREQARLARIGGRIAVAANRQSLQWEYALFDRPDKNAFVLPGGKVGFYRGLMEICERDDHVACVLGHETAHVVGRHAAERYSREIARQGALQVAGAFTDSQIAMAALGLGSQVGLSLPFSREQEAEADRLGVNYMQAAGYDPREAVVFWRRMSQGGGGRGPEFLSTHPDPANRIEALRAYINARGWGPV